VALLIRCSARNTTHIGDLYSAISNSSVRVVSLQIDVISGCSWQSQHFCFQKIPFPANDCHGPSSSWAQACSQTFCCDDSPSTRSAHTCDESWILMKPPAGISWSRNQVFHVTSGISCSERRQKSYAAVGIEGTSHRMFLRMNSELFLSIGLLIGWMMCWVLPRGLDLCTPFNVRQL